MLVSSSKKVALMGALMLGLGKGSWGLWNCGLDQHVFPVDTSRFLVHFTSARDSKYPETGTSQPWIRICLPSDDGTLWTDVRPLEVEECSDRGQTITPARTHLDADLWITAGNGCDRGDTGDLERAAIRYKDQTISLQHEEKRCGPRDHGITCQFDL